MRALRTGLVLALLLLPAAPAWAGTVAVEGGTLVVVGTDGEDDLSVSNAGTPEFEGDGPTYTVFDRRNTLTAAGGPCQTDPEDQNKVVCKLDPGAQPLTAYRIDARGGNDTLVGSQYQELGGTLVGGAGDDQLGGGGGPDVLEGGDGNDTLRGDERFEGSGQNSLKAPDEVRGGPGTDTMRYSGHNSSSVVASLDDQANDGQPGEGDNVHSDVENLEGDFDGTGNTLTGDDDANELLGASTADVLTGGGGNDRLRGFDGNDRLDGGGGDDFLEGGFDDDTLEGGAGTDSFVGDETRQETIGTGNDTLQARDGVAEPVSCGPGADRATVDADDVVATDPQNGCETVDRAAGGGGGGGGDGGGTPATAFPLGFGARSVRASRTGRVVLRLRCRVTDPAGCNGVLRVKSAKRVRIGGRRATLTVGSRSFSIAPGESLRVRFKLSGAERRALRRLKRVRIVARATERAASPRTATRKLTLRRP